MKMYHLYSLLLLLCFSCNPAPEKTGTTGDHATDHAAHTHHESLPAGQPSEQSIYALSSPWRNQTGQEIQLQQSQGKIHLVAMVYASCTNACPRIIADMKAIEAKLSPQALVQLTLISIDPEVDTPERLQALAQKSQLGSRWQLLTGEPDSVRELAIVLGVQYKKINDTDYAHSNLISVLNPKGEIVHQQQGLGIEPSETIKVIQSLHSL